MLGFQLLEGFACLLDAEGDRREPLGTLEVLPADGAGELVGDRVEEDRVAGHRRHP